MRTKKKFKTATLYRTEMADHICPHGLKCKDLLQREGFSINDQKLKSREEVDTLKSQYKVMTVPQVFIDGVCIGGFDDLRQHFGKAMKSEDEVTYRPIIALFSVGCLLALTISWLTLGNIFSVQTVEWFVSVSMVLLGLQKLMDIERFATAFLSYDLLAQRWVRYGYIYPFVEAGAGIMMITGIFNWISAPAAFIIATIGAIAPTPKAPAKPAKTFITA